MAWISKRIVPLAILQMAGRSLPVPGNFMMWHIRLYLMNILKKNQK
jgi:hypothetical protein